MTQSPLQEAIEIFRNRKELSSVSPYSLGMADAIAVLESLLPKEKELIREVFKAGWRARNIGENYTLGADLEKYLSNQNKP